VGILWKFYGNSQKFFCEYGMYMGIEIQFSRQPGVAYTAMSRESRACTFRYVSA